MSKQEAAELLEFLSSIWPRQYSPNMTDQRRITLMETFMEVFLGYDLDEVIDACKAMLKTHDDAPTVSMILNRCQLARENERVAAQAKENRVDLNGLPEHHPWRGCFVHAEAYDKCMEAIKSGDTKAGANFSAYCQKYPAMKWRPWANPALCKNNWPYITRDNFGGWKTDERGFCVPYTK